MTRELITEHLVLKPIEETDAKALYKIIGDRETAWWSDDFRCHDLKEAVESITWWNEKDSDMSVYGLFKKDSGELVGFLQIKLPGMTGMQNARELGYVLSKDHRRNGYMSEAVDAVCNDLFKDETIECISLEILPDNLPSLGVARKCGFFFVEEPEEKKQRRFLDDKPLDRYVRYRQPKS